jgi:hypothetical protein
MTPARPVAMAAMFCVFLIPAAEAKPVARLTLKSSEPLASFSMLMNASYLKPKGPEMVRLGGYSADNGRTWTEVPVEPNFDQDLPQGFRRESFPLFVDHTNDRFIRLVPALPREPRPGQELALR